MVKRSNEHKQKGAGRMSAVARNYSYQVKIDKDSQRKEPTISLETLVKYKMDTAKYLKGRK